jgi:ribosomal protein S27AE
MTQFGQNRHNESCPKCGSEYEVIAVHSEDAQGEHRCRCGYLLRTWRGMVAFRFRLVRMDEPAALNLESEFVSLHGVIAHD